MMSLAQVFGSLFRPPTSADELTKSDWRKQSFALQDQAAKKLDEVRRAVEEFSPEEFFAAEPARVEWSGSAKVHGLAFSELQTIAGLRLVTSREQKLFTDPRFHIASSRCTRMRTLASKTF